MKRIALLPALALLAACGPSRDNFWDKAVGAMCDKYFECYADEAEQYWGDEDSCVEDFMNYMEEDYYEDCEYDRGAAKDCINAYEDLSCDPSDEDYEALDVCEDVWDCPDDNGEEYDSWY